jgi:4'-phosphopantetheinyl transferase
VNPSDVRPALLAPHVVQVWVIFLPHVRASLESLRGILSPEESSRADRFAFERDRNRFILARGTLRVLLAAYLNQDPARISFRYGAHGKPGLVAEENRFADLRFNLSHSGDYCLCAVALGREVGIDVEVVRSDIACLDLAERFFTRREYDDVRQAPEENRHARFFGYWTCKEAYLKARGIGIASGLARLDVIFHADGSVSCGAVDDGTVPGARWIVRPVPMAGNVAAAVAAEGDDWEVAVSAYPASAG